MHNVNRKNALQLLDSVQKVLCTICGERATDSRKHLLMHHNSEMVIREKIDPENYLKNNSENYLKINSESDLPELNMASPVMDFYMEEGGFVPSKI